MNELQNVEEIERMLSISDIARIMNYSTNTVRELVKSNAFTRVHRPELGNGKKGHIRIYESDFERWRENCTQEEYNEEG
jgi:hypothetical protein|tara:strand:+ start:1205 stop:1441 length:237 start_codon:yes stop_codon:yes gene_type:complete